MKRVINAKGTEFGHTYYTSIDEQLAHWESEPIEFYYECEMAEVEEEMRQHAYLVILDKLFDAAEAAIKEGHLSESIAIGEVYNDWIKICKKAGVM